MNYSDARTALAKMGQPGHEQSDAEQVEMGQALGFLLVDIAVSLNSISRSLVRLADQHGAA